ncbi:hypothetical protein [Streptomyces sp. NPDC059224]|uniref:hypothetical protein n=1 Tax=Streptomyces sp. NPDC059224 TaxID=3346775 RepID=UPI003693F1BC
MRAAVPGRRPHLAGDRRTFNAEVLAAFTDEVRGNGLATVAGPVGAFGGFGRAEPFVRRIGGHTVADIPPRYAAGETKARVAFDADEPTPSAHHRPRPGSRQRR